MMSFLLDSNCMIAMLSEWDPRRQHATAEWRRRLAAGERPLLAAHCWSETFSVLTRLPSDRRLGPAHAWEMLNETWNGFEVLALTAAEWLQTLADCAQAGIGGGRIYDELIAACARKAKVDTLLTFNPRHFERHADWFTICVPGRS